MDSMLRSLRTSVRTLRKSPMFTLIAVATLAIGIGANTAIFSVVHGVLIRPLPYSDSERLVGVWHTAPGLGFDQFEHSDATYLLYRSNNTVFEEMGASRTDRVNLTGDGTPEALTATRVTPSVLALLGVPPQLGRSFVEIEERPGAEPTVILSHGLWTRRYAADPAILGRVIHLDGTARTVVGVMPPGFAYPSPETRLWYPLVFDPDDVAAGDFVYAGIARLKEGFEPAEAAADLSALVSRIPDEYPNPGLSKAMLENARMACMVHPLRDDVVGEVGGVLRILLGNVGLILLIACANVASLFVARLEGRRQEVAVRTALGASRAHVVRGFMTEATLLSLVGGALGLGLSTAALRLFLRLAPDGIPRLHEVAVDGAVLIFALTISLISALAFGGLPALRAVPDLGATLREGSTRTTAGRLRIRSRNLLVVAQLALALVLTASSGLLVRSFAELRSVDPGIESSNVLTMRLSAPTASYPSPVEAASFHAQVLDRVRAVPGVTSVGATTGLPLTAEGSNTGYTFEDFPLPEDQVPPILFNENVAPGFFDALGIPLVEGRVFERADIERATRSVIVSASLAQRFWPGESPLGKRITTGIADEDSVWSTIVGVVGDVRYLGLEQEPPAMVYTPLLHQNRVGEDNVRVARTLTLTVRCGVQPTSLIEPVRRAIWSLDPNLPVANIRTMADVQRQASARTGFTMLLLLIAGIVALVLGAVGLYGVISYVVGRRTREIGVRMALGADHGSVARMVLGQGLVLAVAGLGVGLVSALAVTRLMTSVLFEVSPTDPVTFGSVSLLLLAVAAGASWLPARRAASVNPLEALRYE